MIELALDLSDVEVTTSFLSFGFGFKALLVAAVFMAVSFGGGGEELLPSLSLLLSGLNILFVFNFFWVSLAASFDGSLVGDLCVCFPLDTGFLGTIFGGGLFVFVTGVTVAVALGFGWGFLFAFCLLFSSDSEEYTAEAFWTEVDRPLTGLSLFFAVSDSVEVLEPSVLLLVAGVCDFFLGVGFFLLSESVEPCALLTPLVDEFSLSEELDSLPDEEDEEDDDDELLLDEESELDGSWKL